MTDKLDTHLEDIATSRRGKLGKLVLATAFATPVAFSLMLGATQPASALVVATGSGKAVCTNKTTPVPQKVVDNAKNPIYSAGTSY